MFIIRGICLAVFAVFTAGLIFWGIWSLQMPSSPSNVVIPDDHKSTPVNPRPRPIPTPKPEEEIEVEPAFSHLATAPVNHGSIKWDAVYTLGHLAEIAYASADDQILRAKALGADTVSPLAVGSSEGFVASDAHCVVISFRGTQGIRDIVTDTLGFPSFMNGGIVHHGFSRAIGSIYQSAISAAETQGALDPMQGKTIWVTGHSLGGAIACGFSMAATKENRLKIDGIVTYGQPLVMNSTLCQFMLDEYGDRYLRVVNGVDPITTLVKLYRHSGARVQIHDDGDYDWQPPRIATMAPPPGVERPEVVIVEANPDLELMSVDDAMELDRKIKAAQDGETVPVAPVPKAVGAFFVDPAAEHYMPGYLSRLRQIARKKAMKPTVSD